MNTSVILRPETPPVADYRRLRRITGLSEKSNDDARHGLGQTWFGVTAFDGELPVGMGRIIGDGGTVLMLVDMAVDPAYQGRGIGKRILGRLMAQIESEAAGSAYVCLFADGDARYLYEKFGFRATAPETIGMAWRRVQRE